MADAAHDHGNYDHGQMEIREQRETFHAFIKMSKWGCLAIAVGVLFFAMLFCTDNGFLASGAAAFIVLVAGIFLLKEKGHGPASH